jgi:hypothetical protein
MVRLHRVCVAMHVPVAQILTRDRRFLFQNCGNPKYAGIAPVMERSGKQSWVHWRCQCPKFLRQTFVEWATGSIRFSCWARAYYEQQRDKGASHQAAVRALAFKWIRIVFRCWQTGVPYNESVYIAALQRRGSVLISHLAPSS